MRKTSFYVWSLAAALFMTACSDQNDNIQPSETTSLEFSVDFGEIVKSRAATTGVPETSWDNIDKVQFFLYDGTGTVAYSVVADPKNPASTSGSILTFVYTDVPVGTGYTLVAVANVHPTVTKGAVSTNVPSLPSPTVWNASNVRQKNISGLTITHQAASFPTYTDTQFVPSEINAFETPTEIFMAEHATTVNIVSGTMTDLSASPLQLKREVSLMRVRLNIKDSFSGVNNTPIGEKGVDWTKDISVLLYSLPQDMKIGKGDKGGVSTTSIGTNVQVAKHLAGTAFSWYTANPTGGYSDLNMIDDKNFERWADIVVFPNIGVRGTIPSNAETTHAATTQKYTIIVTAQGQTGHVLANGDILPGPTSIYWDGLINEAFFPNSIREVNLTLQSGGKAGPLPAGPVEKGELTITVSEPADWSSNILRSDINM